MPIKFKIENEEKVSQVFSIKSYRQPSIYIKEQDVYFGRPFQTKSILDFDCKIEVFGTEKVIILRYFADKMEWKIMY